MILSDIGKITDEFWQEIPKHFPFVNLDAFVIMPNHVHGLVEILPNACRDEALPRLYTGRYPKMSEISPIPGSLAVIIGSYKSAVSKIVRKKLNPTDFAWQSRFYDHIICDKKSLNKIREYIANNPKIWERDRNNEVENIWM